jgi:hypothetical protein
MKHLTTDRKILLGVIGYFLGIVFLISYFSQDSQPWLFYHKPEFKGQLVDYDTKQPIEGSVVEVLYFKYAGHAGVVFKSEEMLTDKEGKFQFPKYSTFLSPLWFGGNVRFKFYKPGYVYYEDNDDRYLGNFMKLKTHEYFPDWNKSKIVKSHGSIIELSKLESKENRLRALQEAKSIIYREDRLLPLREKLIDEESMYLRSAAFP